MFPVKLGPLASTCLEALILSAALALPSCGYHSAYAGGPPRARLTVASAELTSPHVGALDAALAGAREELSHHGALTAGSGYPRMVVELVRVDEVAVGIRAAPGPAPLASGSSVGVTARAWVQSSPGGDPEGGSGDVRRVVTVAQGAEPLAGRQAFEEATLAAARLVGQALARRVLGIVEPAVEPM